MKQKPAKIYQIAIIVAVIVLVPLQSFSTKVLASPNSTFHIQILPAPQCSDGIDNDLDGLIDYPADPNCSSSSDDFEGVPPSTNVILRGRAYPLSHVTILKDAQIVSNTIAGPDAKFSVTLSGLSAGNYIFSIYGEDRDARRSKIFTFQIGLTLGTTTEIGGIFVAPTIDVDKDQVKKGDNIAIFGQSAPSAQVTISVHSNPEYFVQTNSDADGIYLLNFDTAPLEFGTHTSKSKGLAETEISDYGSEVDFIVGSRNVPKGGLQCDQGDINCDGRVNLIDFSIAAYWYKRTLDAEMTTIEAQLLSGDGIIDLIDFSVMAYYWTG